MYIPFRISVKRRQIMKRIICVTFALFHLIISVTCLKASAITDQTVVIEGVSYSISNQNPYVIIVPETLNVGEEKNVYLAGAITGDIYLSVPSSLTLVQQENKSNTISCSIVMGNENKLNLDTSANVKTVSAKIKASLDEKVPLKGTWKGNLTYSLSENIIKDITPFLEFTLSSDGTYYIVSGVKDTSFLSYCNYNMVIPAMYNGKPVKEIGDKAFYAASGYPLNSVAYRRGVIAITIPSTVTTIGKYAFSYFGGSGTKVTVEGNGLKTVDQYAFYNSGFSGVNLPNSVTVIEKNAFALCGNLIDINIPPYVTKIGDWAFDSCKSISGELVLPSTLTSLGQGAFEDCTSVTTIRWNCKLSYIRYGVFRGCKALKNFHMSSEAQSALRTIEGYAFYYCSGITEFTVPSQVTSIEKYAFYNSGLTKVTYPAGISIGTKAFPSPCVQNAV